MTTKHSEHIYPVFDRMLQRSDKEKLLKQRAKVIWMTGLSGSGKTTIALGFERLLYNKGFLTQVLDGDNIRSGINSNLGFTEEDRAENIRRIAEISKLFVNCGVITINCFVSPTIAIRENAKQIIGEQDFVEVFVNTPLEICEQRDVKGLYKKARAGEIKNFTGIDAPFEAPVNPDIEIKTENKTIEESVQELADKILPLIQI
ncbi:MAG TPA: adenylyl-sulfate kinase [Flavobacteriales bacterium]|nr:adenylyl-sulfate kinase [Flavobacteriales bacterium]|tara:strand:+ start:17595 stop:18203 length:609 start_codon:yes stop_codon:yes gene_type:complete